MSTEQEHDDVSEATNTALHEIESQPLEQRAAGYQTLSEQLRAELEHSDPSRAAD